MNENDLQKLKKEMELILYQKNKISSITRMISNITYQWKLPLSIIATASSGIKLKKEMNLLQDSELISTMNLINNSAQNLSHTIDEFKIYLYPNDNEHKKFNLLKTFERIFILLNIEFHSKNIEIIKNIEDIEIISIENKLTQVLVNILSNLIDLSNQQISFNKKQIFINAYKQEESLFIYIKSNIKILSENEILNLYKLPYIKDDLEKTKIDLYTSMTIITKLLNGQLIIRNKNFIYQEKKYKGTKFIIKLKI